MKYGEYKITRTYSSFRVRVDRKKLEKLKRDVDKLERKQIHLRRERIRLMKKAVKETRARNRARAAKKASQKRR